MILKFKRSVYPHDQKVFDHVDSAQVCITLGDPTWHLFRTDGFAYFPAALWDLVGVQYDHGEEEQA